VEIDKAGDNWQENSLVFCTGRGTLINPTNLRRRSLTPLLQRACLPPMTFHQLRHTAATILLLKNVNPKVVSEMLGHATIAITLDTYSHVLPNMQHSAVAAMEEVFSCSSSKNTRSRRADSSWDEAGRCLNRSRTTRTRVCSPQLPSGPRSSRRWANPTHHLGQSVG
jgi:hypothetical protein